MNNGVDLAGTKTGRLYAILDDIDSLSDAIKPNDIDGYKAYMKAVIAFTEKRHLLFETDGYAVFEKSDVE